ALLERLTACDGGRLIRYPRAQTVPNRAAFVINLRLLAGNFPATAANADLPLQACPEESEGSLRVARQFPSLAAFVVGIEHEAPGVDRLEQHDARGRLAFAIHRGQSHCVGFHHARGERLLEPVVELLNRIRVQVPPSQPGKCVLSAQIGYFHRDKTLWSLPENRKCWSGQRLL